MAMPMADRPTFDRQTGDIPAEIRKLSSPDERVRLRAAATIADAAATGAEDITDAVASNHGIDALLPLLKSASTQAEALRAIAELAPATGCQQQMMRAGGVVETLIGFLISRNPTTQQHTARALANLAVSSTHQVRIAELGGITGVVQLLQRSGDSEVQLQAAGALHNLSFNERNKMKIVAADGHLAMIALLPSHDIRCQLQAAAVLANLSFYPDNKLHIASAGGIEALVGLLHSNVDEVKQESASGLARLAANNLPNAERALQAGAVLPLVEMMDSRLVDCRHFAEQALQSIGVDIKAARDEAAVRRARALGSADERATLLLADGDSALLEGETLLAATHYGAALQLGPSESIAIAATAKQSRAQREITAERCSIESLGNRAFHIRNTRQARNATSKSPLELPLADGLLNIVALFRTIHRHEGSSAPFYLRPEFVAARNRLDAAEARLDQLQSLLHIRVVGHKQQLDQERAAAALRSGRLEYRQATNSRKITRPAAELEQLLHDRDRARAEYVMMGRAFVAATHGDSFRQHHEFAVHALGPLQQATDRLSAVLGPRVLELAPGPGRPADVAAHISAALTAFEGWVAANTSATVEARTERSLAELLSCTASLLGPPPTDALQSAPGQGKKARQALLTTTLPAVVAGVATALSAEESFWDDSDPMASLPTAEIHRAARAALVGLRRQVADVAELQGVADLLEQTSLPAAAVWIGAPAPTTAVLSDLEDRDFDHRDALETAMFEITKLRNRPERLREADRIEALESTLPGLRKAVYDSDLAVSNERARVVVLAHEHFPELPLVYPEAALDTVPDPLVDSPLPRRRGAAAQPLGQHVATLVDEAERVEVADVMEEGGVEVLGQQPARRTESAFEQVRVNEAVVEGSAELTVDRMELEGKKAAIRHHEVSLSGLDRVDQPAADRLRRRLADDRAGLRRAERAFMLKCSLAGHAAAGESYSRIGPAERADQALTALKETGNRHEALAVDELSEPLLSEPPPPPPGAAVDQTTLAAQRPGQVADEAVSPRTPAVSGEERSSFSQNNFGHDSDTTSEEEAAGGGGGGGGGLAAAQRIGSRLAAEQGFAEQPGDAVLAVGQDSGQGGNAFRVSTTVLEMRAESRRPLPQPVSPTGAALENPMAPLVRAAPTASTRTASILQSLREASAQIAGVADLASVRPVGSTPPPPPVEPYAQPAWGMQQQPGGVSPPVAVLGYDTSGDGRLDGFDTNADGQLDARSAAAVWGTVSMQQPPPPASPSATRWNHQVGGVVSTAMLSTTAEDSSDSEDDSGFQARTGSRALRVGGVLKLTAATSSWRHTAAAVAAGGGGGGGPLLPMRTGSNTSSEDGGGTPAHNANWKQRQQQRPASHVGAPIGSWIAGPIGTDTAAEPSGPLHPADAEHAARQRSRAALLASARSLSRADSARYN